MDLGKKLDDKLRVRYIPEGEEKERRRKKRKEAFADQVKRGVTKLHVRDVVNSCFKILILNLRMSKS